MPEEFDPAKLNLDTQQNQADSVPTDLLTPSSTPATPVTHNTTVQLQSGPRPSYLNYDGKTHNRSLSRVLPIILVVILVPLFLFLVLKLIKTAATSANINEVTTAVVEVSPTPFSDTTCPEGTFIDCRTASPGPECGKKYIDWAKKHCPGFVGAAY